MRSIAFAVLLLAALPLQAGSAMARLASVDDGNTITVKLRGEQIKIRMHGVAVPPADEARPILQRLNKECVAFLKKYLGDGGWVYLEFPDGGPKADEDGRVPAFVYRSGDATLVNEKVVATGLGLVNKKEKNAFTDKWSKLQETAKAGGSGIWGSFENGDGERLASGTAQSTYIGVGGGGKGGGRTSYVTYWIFLFY